MKCVLGEKRYGNTPIRLYQNSDDRQGTCQFQHPKPIMHGCILSTRFNIDILVVMTDVHPQKWCLLVRGPSPLLLRSNV